jgi:hypothetical protein
MLGYSRMIEEGMAATGFTRNSLAPAVKRSPEHIRKLTESEAFPGPDLQDRLAAVLHLDREKFRESVERDRWIKKTGRKPPLPETPRIPVLERLWPRLTGDQREVLTCVASCLTKLAR